MQFLLLIHDNVASVTAEAEWTAFIERAKDSGMFRGGSELGARDLVGSGTPVPFSVHIGGFMRFETDDKAKLLELLGSHPIVVHGGTVELCEMPESQVASPAGRDRQRATRPHQAGTEMPAADHSVES